MCRDVFALKLAEPNLPYSQLFTTKSLWSRAWIESAGNLSFTQDFPCTSRLGTWHHGTCPYLPAIWPLEVPSHASHRWPRLARTCADPTGSCICLILTSHFLIFSLALPIFPHLKMCFKNRSKFWSHHLERDRSLTTLGHVAKLSTAAGDGTERSRGVKTPDAWPTPTTHSSGLLSIFNWCRDATMKIYENLGES